MGQRVVDKEINEDLRRMCQGVCSEIAEGIEIIPENIDDWEDKEIGDYVDPYEWIARHVYDQRFLINNSGQLIEVQFMVAGGGPTIWVHVSSRGVEVHGHWGGDVVLVDGYYGADGLGLWDFVDSDEGYAQWERR